MSFAQQTLSLSKLLRAKSGESFEPLPHVEQSARNVVNLFEVPVLFYAATFLILELRTQDDITLGLSWTFVLTRIAHSFVHLTSNHVMRRMATYMVGVVTLLALWTYLAWKIFI